MTDRRIDTFSVYVIDILNIKYINYTIKNVLCNVSIHCKTNKKPFKNLKITYIFNCQFIKLFKIIKNKIAFK